MKKTLISVTTAALVAFGTVAGTTVAQAGGSADSTVTIVEQSGDFHGKVMSPRNSCVGDRKVKVMKVKSGPDEYTGYQDTTENNGDWNTGNTSANNGRYYAKVTRTPNCKADVSPTVRV